MLIPLKNGRIVVADMPEPNGSKKASMLDNGPMSRPEWDEFCTNLAFKLGPEFKRVNPPPSKMIPGF